MLDQLYGSYEHDSVDANGEADSTCTFNGTEGGRPYRLALQFSTSRSE